MSPYAMVEVFDDIAQRLAASGFEVTRNPLPLVAVADRRTRVRSWYFATANDALVEFDGDSGRVWLPSYYKRLEQAKKRPAAQWIEQRFSPLAGR